MANKNFIMIGIAVLFIVVLMALAYPEDCLKIANYTNTTCPNITYSPFTSIYQNGSLYNFSGYANFTFNDSVYSCNGNCSFLVNNSGESILKGNITVISDLGFTANVVGNITVLRNNESTIQAVEILPDNTSNAWINYSNQIFNTASGNPLVLYTESSGQSNGSSIVYGESQIETNGIIGFSDFDGNNLKSYSSNVTSVFKYSASDNKTFIIINATNISENLSHVLEIDHHGDYSLYYKMVNHTISPTFNLSTMPITGNEKLNISLNISLEKTKTLSVNLTDSLAYFSYGKKLLRIHRKMPAFRVLEDIPKLNLTY